MCINSELTRNQSHCYTSETCGDQTGSAILPCFLVHFQMVYFQLWISSSIHHHGTKGRRGNKLYSKIYFLFKYYWLSLNYDYLTLHVMPFLHHDQIVHCFHA